jgi:hypothetical protein
MVQRFRMTILLVTLVTLVLTASSGLGAVAADEVPAIPALTEVARVSELVGSESGSYHYYEVAYPGGETEVLIQLRYWPSDPVLAKAVGVNVYGPDIEARGEPKDDGAYLECAYAADDAATLLVQVYSYAPTPIAYKIVADGIPAADGSEPTPAPVVETAAEENSMEAAPAESVATTAAGQVVGNRAGAYALHPVASTGDGSDITVTITFSPRDRAFAEAIGFNIYRPDGERVASGTPIREPGQRVATFAGEVAGNYTVQVYNYQDGLTLSYSLEVSY